MSRDTEESVRLRLAERYGITENFEQQLAEKLRSGEATLTDDLVLWQFTKASEASDLDQAQEKAEEEVATEEALQT